MSFNLLVGNVPVDSTEDSIKKLFEQFGAVRAVTLPVTPNGRSKGFALVAMSTRKEAIVAQNELANCDFGGRVLTVTLREAVVPKRTPLEQFLDFFRK